MFLVVVHDPVCVSLSVKDQSTRVSRVEVLDWSQEHLVVDQTLQPADPWDVCQILGHLTHVQVSVKCQSNGLLASQFPLSLWWVDADQGEWIVIILHVTVICVIITFVELATLTSGVHCAGTPSSLVRLEGALGNKLRDKVQGQTVLGLLLIWVPKGYWDAQLQLVLSLADEWELDGGDLVELIRTAPERDLIL